MPDDATNQQTSPASARTSYAVGDRVTTQGHAGTVTQVDGNWHTVVWDDGWRPSCCNIWGAWELAPFPPANVPASVRPPWTTTARHCLGWLLLASPIIFAAAVLCAVHGIVVVAAWLGGSILSLALVGLGIRLLSRDAPP